MSFHEFSIVNFILGQLSTAFPSNLYYFFPLSYINDFILFSCFHFPYLFWQSFSIVFFVTLLWISYFWSTIENDFHQLGTTELVMWSFVNTNEQFDNVLLGYWCMFLIFLVFELNESIWFQIWNKSRSIWVSEDLGHGCIVINFPISAAVYEIFGA